MTFTIPFNYKRKNNTIMLTDFNDGVILCRKLGWNPIGVILGKMEREDIRHFAHSGAGAQGTIMVRKMFRAMKMPISFSTAQSEISFLCESSSKFI